MFWDNQTERYVAAPSYDDAIMDNPGRIKSIMFMSLT